MKLPESGRGRSMEREIRRPISGVIIEAMTNENRHESNYKENDEEDDEDSHHGGVEILIWVRRGWTGIGLCGGFWQNKEEKEETVGASAIGFLREVYGTVNVTAHFAATDDVGGMAAAGREER